MHPVSAPEQYQLESWRPENWFCCLSLIQRGLWKKVRIFLYKINKTENLGSSSFCLLEATLNINGEAAVSWFIDIHDIYVKIIVLEWHMYRTGYQNSEYFFESSCSLCTLSFKVLKAAYIYFNFHTDHQIITTFFKVAYIQYYSLSTCPRPRSLSLAPCLYPVAYLTIHSI